MVLYVLSRRVIDCPHSSEKCDVFRQTNHASPAPSSIDNGMRYIAAYHLCWHKAVSAKEPLVDTVQ
jgi:hypothetical protein